MRALPRLQAREEKIGAHTLLLLRCLLRAVCGWEPAEPSIEFECFLLRATAEPPIHPIAARL